MPLLPLLTEARADPFLLGLGITDGHRDNLIAQRERGGDGLFGQPGHAAHWNHDKRRQPLRRVRYLPQLKQRADPVVVGPDAGKQQHQQRDDQHDQPRALGELADQLDRQCGPMPACDSVNPTNTPMANSGIKACVLPLATTSRIAAATASTETPYRCTWRSAFSRNRCGRKLSLASRLASTGSPPNEVLAASASSTVVISWM